MYTTVTRGTPPWEEESAAEGKGTMRTSPTWGTQRRSTVGTMVLVLVCAMVISGIALRPAFGQEPERRRWQEERGRDWRERQEERRRYWREQQEERRRRTYPPYGYYAPPPVVYPPVPSPGINLFFHFP